MLTYIKNVAISISRIQDPSQWNLSICRFPEEGPLDDTDSQKGDKYENGDHRGFSKFKPLERCIIKIHHDDPACIGRASLCCDEYLVENLEGKNQFNNQNHDDLVVEQGQSNMSENLGISCSIDLGSLMQVFRNALQGREKDDGVKANAKPDIDGSQGRHHLG